MKLVKVQHKAVIKENIYRYIILHNFKGLFEGFKINSRIIGKVGGNYLVVIVAFRVKG